MDEELIIYLALSNLIASGSIALESINKLPLEQQDKEEKEMLQYIVSEAVTILDKYQDRVIEKGPTIIDRPNWDELKL